MKVLHITNWYPNHSNPHETPFIKAHFDALEGRIQQELWHVQVRNVEESTRLSFGSTGNREHFLLFAFRTNRWRVIELLTLVLLIVVRLRLGRRWWDVVNIHIAYPLLRFPRFFRFLFGRQVVITEHWSAYHNGFQLPKGSQARKRIEQIFHHKIPLVTVSNALMKDIVSFGGPFPFCRYVVPNVVDGSLFQYLPRQRNDSETIFLMVGSWAPIKQPLLAMKAFAEIASVFPRSYLRVVGAGSQFQEMQEFVRNRNLEMRITLLGPLSKAEIAKEMQTADCFLHPSSYETFSVVCAEALCCGLPVIASNVGGIPELIDDESGVLLQNNLQEWIRGLFSFIVSRPIADRKKIASSALERFNPTAVSERLIAVYQQTTVAD